MIRGRKIFPIQKKRDTKRNAAFRHITPPRNGNRASAASATPRITLFATICDWNPFLPRKNSPTGRKIFPVEAVPTIPTCPSPARLPSGSTSALVWKIGVNCWSISVPRHGADRAQQIIFCCTCRWLSFKMLMSPEDLHASRNLFCHCSTNSRGQIQIARTSRVLRGPSHGARSAPDRG
jgi:hypothetical protein